MHKKILIINGNPATGGRDLDRYLASLEKELAGAGHDVNAMILRDMDIRYCTGCWTCWWKTPGRCMHNDDMPALYTGFLASDLVILASPVIMGFVSALLKRATERLVPLIHPYLAIVEGECHHQGRYERYPEWGLIMQKDDTTDDDDIAITSDIYRRTALNIKVPLRFHALTDCPVREVCREIDAL
jgi:hypothetical protein